VLVFGVGAVVWGLLIAWNTSPIGGGLTILVWTLASLRSRRGTAEVVPDEGDETMRAVGMPPANLVPLDADAPEELDLVELPRRL
jgi:hypothetical protein